MRSSSTLLNVECSGRYTVEARSSGKGAARTWELVIEIGNRRTVQEYDSPTALAGAVAELAMLVGAGVREDILASFSGFAEAADAPKVDGHES